MFRYAEFRNPDRVLSAHLGEVIPEKVDDHHVLGAVFLAGAEPQIE